MSKGTPQDCFRRLRSLLPRWFGDQTPILDAILHGIAAVLSHVYGFIGYAKRQTRIRTAEDGWLDFIAHDFFGDSLIRQAGQSDKAFRLRIIANLFRERATRRGLVLLIKELTGREPDVFEPQHAADVGFYGQSRYGQARYGSRRHPYQCWVDIYRPRNATPPPKMGFYNHGRYNRACYGSRKALQGALTDAELYLAVHQVKPVGTIVWVRLV